MLISYLGAALFAVSLLHCKNVGLRPVDPPGRLSRKHERKHGRPLTRYHVLDIAPMRRILDSEGEAQTKGLGCGRPAISSTREPGTEGAGGLCRPAPSRAPSWTTTHADGRYCTSVDCAGGWRGRHQRCRIAFWYRSMSRSTSRCSSSVAARPRSTMRKVRLVKLRPSRRARSSSRSRSGGGNRIERVGVAATQHTVGRRSAQMSRKSRNGLAQTCPSQVTPAHLQLALQRRRLACDPLLGG
jgi:hypothetical protein